MSIDMPDRTWSSEWIAIAIPRESDVIRTAAEVEIFRTESGDIF
jgi:hypothetical protein